MGRKLKGWVSQKTCRRNQQFFRLRRIRLNISNYGGGRFCAVRNLRFFILGKETRVHPHTNWLTTFSCLQLVWGFFILSKKIFIKIWHDLRKMFTKLILIRHGETNLNLQKRYLSDTDIDLNKKGREQAKRLRQRLAKEKIHKVYSSDNKRALNFAKIAFRGFPIEKSPKLREINFGIFEGMNHAEIMKKYPEIYNNWLSNPFATVIPKSENLNNFRKRIIKIFKEIVSLNRNKTIAIVTHAGPIRIIISDILKLKKNWKITPALASITIIQYKRAKFEIMLLNDTTYLNG